MKILKFRIYDKTEKRMKFLESIWNMPDPSYDFDEIQQFTGLLDRSGNEIYEGDVIIWPNFNNGKIIVEWTSETLSWNIASNWYDHDFPDPSKECLVIGNIHENPELLTK